MAERSKALRSGRSPLLWAWVRIPLLTYHFYFVSSKVMENELTFLPFPLQKNLTTLIYMTAEKEE